MSVDRVRSEIVVQACLRAATFKALPAVVLRRGDPDAGMVLVKTLARDGRAVLFGQTIDLDGASVWRRLTGDSPASESEADARIARESNIDPDFWVVEIMDDSHAHPLDPPMLKD